MASITGKRLTYSQAAHDSKGAVFAERAAFKAQKTQQEKFVELARQLAADKNEEVFTDKLRRIAKAKASKKKRS